MAPTCIRRRFAPNQTFHFFIRPLVHENICEAIKPFHSLSRLSSPVYPGLINQSEPRRTEVELCGTRGCNRGDTMDIRGNPLIQAGVNGSYVEERKKEEKKKKERERKTVIAEINRATTGAQP